MKLQIASDLHIEFTRHSFPNLAHLDEADADVLVLAGDIDAGLHAVEQYRAHAKPVVYVHGNHEAYGRHYETLAGQLEKAADGTNVHYLERQAWIYQDVRFLGCCLWTDYRLDGNPLEAMAQAELHMNDHSQIRKGYGMRVFAPADALADHRRSVEWLRKTLAEPFDGKTVVVTHHGVTPQSIDPKYAGDPLNPAFASDLTDLVGLADLWIHGHTHRSLDYQVGRCRVIANPRGYPLNRGTAGTGEDLRWENPEFYRALVVTI
jgi:predicted phosphodiesterase